MRFKCVSKGWQSLIQEPFFVKLHNNRSKRHPKLLITTSGNDGSFLILSSEDELKGGVAHLELTIPRSEAAGMLLKPINGLFCFVNLEQGLSRIYNFGTRQASPWVRTSPPLVEMGANPFPNYAFGFDPSTGKHKVLCIWSIFRGAPGTMKVDFICEVFTVGENQWRRIGGVLPVVRLDGRAVYANGSIYVRSSGLNFFSPPDKEPIVAFDVGTEKFRVIEIPNYSGTPQENYTRREVAYLLQVDGYIALVDRVNDHVVKLWISDDSYNEKKRTTKWTEETILLPFPWIIGDTLDINAVEGTDELIIKSPIPSGETLPRAFASLYIYDRVTKSSQKINITGILLTHPYDYNMYIYHESLLPVQKPREELPDQPRSYTTGLKMEENTSQIVDRMEIDLY